MDRVLKCMFDYAIEIELYAAKVYKRYEKLFKHIPDVSDLWRTMALDEIRHAEILSETKRSLSPEVLETNPGNRMWENIYMVKKKLEDFKREEVKNLHDAIEISHQIENSEINAIFKFLNSEYFSTHVRNAFVESEIMDHQKKLVDFSIQYSTKSERESILIRAGA